MRYLYLIFISVFFGCQTHSNENKLNKIAIISGDSVQGPFNFMEIEFKRYNKDSIQNVSYDKDYSTKRDVFDVFAIKRGDSILVISSCIGCMFTTNSFIINIKREKYSCILEESSCSYSLYFIPSKQKLILNDSSYVVGDTIEGYIDYMGRYSPDSLNRFYEEASVRGSFKTVLRDTSYDYQEVR